MKLQLQPDEISGRRCSAVLFFSPAYTSWSFGEVSIIGLEGNVAVFD
jgi:hypothetical protein